jgi:heme/copper-type cytochrome/quinol oxidase subunit 2
VTIKPDFAGEGYDKYLPDTIIVNQNDLVYIKIRNTDQNSYGFSLPGFSINNETIAGAQNTTQALSPTDTYITPFFASQPGIYEFFSTSYPGQGDDQMIGYLVVLPTQNSTTTTTQPTPTPSEPMSTLIFAGISIALLIVGILIGITIVTKFDKESPGKNPTANS